MLRVLVTSAGGPGAVNLCRSLRRAPDRVALFGVDASPHYIYLAEVDRRALVPRLSEPEALLDALRDVIRTHAIDVVMTASSPDARLLSAQRDTLDAALHLPSPAALDLGQSKWDTWCRWSASGLPVPRTWLIEGPPDVARAFESVGAGDQWPLWVRGAGIPGKGIGVASLPCRSVSQALAWIDYWRGYGGMIASEFLPGRNLTWISLWRRGTLVTSCARERLAYVIPHVSPSGITGAPAISRIVHRPDLDAIGPRAVHAIDPDFDGPCFIDAKEDRDGTARLTEINVGRFGTTAHFYTEAGLNLPWISACIAAQRPFDVPALHAPLPEGLTWIRTLDCGPVLVSESHITSHDYSAVDGDWPD